MYRTSHAYLMDWVGRESRRPLIVRGARQVGKSTLVRMLAETAFDSLIEINLERDPDVAGLFASRRPRQILRLLEARFEQEIVPGRSLLFLDEIQAAPELLACLRYFYEELPELHVVAAGSLLDLALAEPSFSMPVGRIEYLHLGPMSFEEFLVARGRDKLQAYLHTFELERELPESLHQDLLSELRLYLVVGGMPASVSAFVRSDSFRESEILLQAILATFRDDFGKYGAVAPQRRIAKVFERIPRMVGRKFMYSQVDRTERAAALSQALERLCLARVASRICHSAAGGVPLGAEAKDSSFKVLFLDVGLLCRSCGLSLLDVQPGDDLMLVNAGAVAEQFIGQHLLHSGAPYEEPVLYCWMKQKKSSNAEVDYLLPMGTEVIPVEVKAGKTGTLKSLHLFLREKQRSLGLRFNADLPSLLEAKTSVAGGAQRPFRLLSLPLYLVGQSRRLLRHI